MEYWENLSGILDLWKVKVFHNEFVIVVVLLVCIVGDKIVNMVFV